MTPSSRGCLAAILVLGAACGEEGGRLSGAQPFATRDSAGVEIIENGSRLWEEDEGWAVDSVPILQIGRMEGEDPYLFRGVTGATRSPDGRIALVETQTREIRIFDPGGRHLSTFGGAGEGPGYFRDRPVLAPAVSDTLVVLDPAARRLTWFMGDGRIVREANFAAGLAASGETVAYSSYSWDARSDGTVFSRHETSFTDAAGEVDRYVIRPVIVVRAGHSFVPFGEFPVASIHFAPPTGGGQVDLIPDPTYPGTRVAFGPGDAELAISDSLRWAIGFHAEDGELERIVRAEVPTLPVTAEMRARLTERVEIPLRDTIPPIATLTWDRAGNLWVGRRGEAYRARWVLHHDVVTPAGRWLGAVEIPQVIGDQPFEIGDDYILARWRDELDVTYLRMYRIRKGEGDEPPPAFTDPPPALDAPEGGT